MTDKTLQKQTNTTGTQNLNFKQKHLANLQKQDQQPQKLTNKTKYKYTHYISFILDGGDVQHQWKLYVIPPHRKNSPRPITSYKNLMSRIHKHQKKHTYTNLTNETDSLQRQLQKDLNKTLKLQHILQNLEAKTHSSKYSHQQTKRKKKQKKHPRKRKNYSNSSTSSETTSSSSSEESTD